MKRKCPECETIIEFELITKPEEFVIKGESITVNVELLHCPNCGAEFEDMNSKNDPYEQAYKEYDRRKVSKSIYKLKKLNHNVTITAEITNEFKLRKWLALLFIKIAVKILNCRIEIINGNKA